MGLENGELDAPLDSLGCNHLIIYTLPDTMLVRLVEESLGLRSLL